MKKTITLIKLKTMLVMAVAAIFSLSANAALIYTQTFTPNKVLSRSQSENYFFDLTPAYNPLTDVVQYLYVDYVFSEIEDNDVDDDFTTWEGVQFVWAYYERIYIPDIDNETISFGGYRGDTNRGRCDVWQIYENIYPPVPDECIYSIDLLGNMATGFTSATDNLRIEAVTLTAHILKPDATVPEPGTWVLLTTGLLGVAGLSRRRMFMTP